MHVNSRINGEVPVVSPEQAVTHISSDASVVVSGFGSVGYPKDVPIAIANSSRNFALTLVSGGSVGEEIDEILVEADAIERRFPYQAQSKMRNAANSRAVAFHDRNVASLGDEVRFGHLVDADVAVVEAVAVGEDWLIPSASIGQTPAFVESVERLIVEVNHALPLDLQKIHDVYRLQSPPDRQSIPLDGPLDRIGEPQIRFDAEKLVCVVETERPDSSYEFRDPTEDDYAIARNLSDFLQQEVERSSVFDDRVHLQFGVGSLGNALMSELGNVDLNGRDVIYYGEVFQDGLLDMLDRNKLEGASATSLALSSEGQNRLFDEIDRYSEDIVLRPTEISNNPAPINRFGVVAVNSGLEVDIYGNVNSTHLNGSRVINGIGGSCDFNRNSPIAICTLPSTHSNGEISRIVPLTLHIDHTEHNIDVVITDQGIADLRGLAPVERAEHIIEQCSHPSFRSSLRRYLERAKANGGHIPHDFERARSWVLD